MEEFAKDTPGIPFYIAIFCIMTGILISLSMLQKHMDQSTIDKEKLSVSEVSYRDGTDYRDEITGAGARAEVLGLNDDIYIIVNNTTYNADEIKEMQTINRTMLSSVFSSNATYIRAYELDSSGNIKGIRYTVS